MFISISCDSRRNSCIQGEPAIAVVTRHTINGVFFAATRFFASGYEALGRVV
jgi:hypothetical protein